MVAGKSSESLPPGFAEKIKYKNGRKIKFYFNAVSGVKYYSKKELLRATTEENGLAAQTKKGNGDGGGRSNKNVDAVPVRIDETSQGLPEGWIMEEKMRNGSTKKGSAYKVYTHLSSGKKFYSMATVTQYLNTLDGKNNVTAQDEDVKGEGNKLFGTPQTVNGDDNDLTYNNEADAAVVEAEDSPNWLPENWIMEVKTRQNGRTKGVTYKVYIEWSTGKKFYSKAAVTHYLKSVRNKDVMSSGTADEELHSTPQTKKRNRNALSVDKNSSGVPVKTNDSSKWLPEGWIVEEKPRSSGSSHGSTYKIYIDPSSGKKFYSRNTVVQYLNTISHKHTPTVPNEVLDSGTPEKKDSIDCTPQAMDGDDVDIDIDHILYADENVGSASVKTNNSSQWLPEGWTVEEKPRQRGSSYKVYTELSSGKKFYSRPEVTRYLNAANHADNASVQKNTDKSGGSLTNASTRRISKTSSSRASTKKENSNNKMITSEITPADDLPPGWIKEIRTSKSRNKIRKDPFYTDPVSGYVFRSKLDALRYLETNDIHSCACKPFKRESDDLKLIGNDINSPNTDGEKSSKQRKSEESYGAGGETSGTKRRAESMAEIPEKAEGNGGGHSPGKQTNGSWTDSSKSKKIRDSELPQRTSKMLFDTGLSSDIEPEEISENPHTEKPEKSPESQLGNDFGDSWSDPVEFALKTLCGEIPIDDNLPFPGDLNKGLNEPADAGPKPMPPPPPPPPSDEPVNFKNEFVPSAGTPSKRHGALALLQSNPTFSAGGEDGESKP
ncbi:uncharacterized protein LOC127250385 [Andrographis paniculata]|uniref:uncharacterized protein LOC127250385 n=1 Tax=Andrographis paniculata TaxID=175694 RepID=UPI0021E875E5|nr:uncharacterized protein LOC127250385 [Andrographis paniculata]